VEDGRNFNRNVEFGSNYYSNNYNINFLNDFLKKGWKSIIAVVHLHKLHQDFS